MTFTQGLSFLVNQRSETLSLGMQITIGMSLSEQTLAKALAVLPADWTTRIFLLFLGSLAQTENASVSLKEQVSIFAPLLGTYPDRVIYRLSIPRRSESPLLL